MLKQRMSYRWQYPLLCEPATNIYANFKHTHREGKQGLIRNMIGNITDIRCKHLCMRSNSWSLEPKKITPNRPQLQTCFPVPPTPWWWKGKIPTLPLLVVWMLNMRVMRFFGKFWKHFIEFLRIFKSTACLSVRNTHILLRASKPWYRAAGHPSCLDLMHEDL